MQLVYDELPMSFLVITVQNICRLNYDYCYVRLTSTELLGISLSTVQVQSNNNRSVKTCKLVTHCNRSLSILLLTFQPQKLLYYYSTNNKFSIAIFSSFKQLIITEDFYWSFTNVLLPRYPFPQ